VKRQCENSNSKVTKEFMEKGVLVIGGGVTGVQASLDLANTGYKVYLVEKSPILGGKMDQIHKIFTSMDCTS